MPQGLGATPLALAPGQRADLLLAPDHTINLALDLFEDTVEIAYLVQSGEGVPQPLPDGFRLPDNPTSRTPDMAKARHVPVVLEGGIKGGLAQALLNGKTTDLRGLLEHGFGWAINGAAGPGGPPLVEAARGETVIFDIDNRTAFEQALHIHGHVWQAIDGTDAQAWRDTTTIAAHAVRSLAFVADNPGTWALQSLHAERADGGLMAAFRVF
jgi:FtsP/CotA-like multicopper oxidase with cupredoxin domain